jgi:UDP-N-acetylglucosamine 3-dehydrogenase
VSKVKFGLVGYGAMGRNHARVLNSFEHVQLVAIADSNSALGSSLDGTPRVDSVSQLIELGIDGCVVAAPTSLHREIGELLASSKIPTLLEKPLAGTVNDAQSIVDVFAENKILGAVGHIERYNPAIQALKIRLEEGQLGEIYQISTLRHGPFSKRIGDVGVVSDLASHDIDLTSHLAGSSYEYVQATSANKSGREHEDLISVTGKLNNGIVINHIVNWLSPMKQRQTVVTGERGALIASTLTGTLTFYENSEAVNPWEGSDNFKGVAEGNVTQYVIPKTEPLRNELSAFIDAITSSNHSNLVSVESGLETVKTCHAILESSKLAVTTYL